MPTATKKPKSKGSKGGKPQAQKKGGDETTKAKAVSHPPKTEPKAETPAPTPPAPSEVKETAGTAAPVRRQKTPRGTFQNETKHAITDDPASIDAWHSDFMDIEKNVAKTKGYDQHYNQLGPLRPENTRRLKNQGHARWGALALKTLVSRAIDGDAEAEGLFSAIMKRFEGALDKAKAEKAKARKEAAEKALQDALKV